VQILNAATRLFAAHGFQGTTLQQVADAVGIRKPSVLHHFSSKEALFEAVSLQVLEHWSEVLPNAVRQAATGIARFELLSRELIKFYLDVPDRARLALRQALDQPQVYRRNIEEHILPWFSVISAGLKEGQRRGLYRPGVDPEMYLLNVVQLVIVSIATEGVLSLPTEGGEGPARERALRELLRIVRDSLLSPIASNAVAPADPIRERRG
jgi:TetR/AcrR family transcriptional regulator